MAKNEPDFKAEQICLRSRAIGCVKVWQFLLPRHDSFAALGILPTITTFRITLSLSAAIESHLSSTVCVRKWPKFFLSYQSSESFLFHFWFTHLLFSYNKELFDSLRSWIFAQSRFFQPLTGSKFQLQVTSQTSLRCFINIIVLQSSKKSLSAQLAVPQLVYFRRTHTVTRSEKVLDWEKASMGWYHFDMRFGGAWF